MRARSIDERTERAKILAWARLGVSNLESDVVLAARRRACERLVQLESRPHATVIRLAPRRAR